MRYISLLRGINVSGQKQIKMQDLKSLYEGLGFDNVVTYIQSGNVIFDTTEKNVSKLKQNIENAIHNQYRFQVPVEIRTRPKLAEVIKKCPFDFADVETNGTKVLVTFLSASPLKKNINNLMDTVQEPEKLVIKKREVYLFCPNGYGKSKLSNTFLERKLEVGATTRNWKSVNTLYELSKGKS